MTRGTGSSSSDRPLPSHGSSNLANSSLVNGLTFDDAGLRADHIRHRRRCRGRYRAPASGRTWMVISLATSDCHSAADALDQ